MLKNQDAVPEPPLTVSQMRVTPDELTHALAAIEARRQADAGTIPLDQAVSELHLDSTSDEIWAEVQAQRASTSAARPAQTAPEQEAPLQAVATPPAVIVRGWGSYIAPAVIVRGWRDYIAPAVIVWTLFSAGIIPQFWNNHTPVIKHQISSAAPILRPLSAVPDGTEVYADDAALIQISEGKPAAQVTVSQNPSGSRWNLIKTGGHVYLRGYIESADSFKPLQGKPLNVYNDDNSGELEGHSTSEITLRVDNTSLQKSGGDDGYSEVTVPNFQPDPLTTLSPWH